MWICSSWRLCGGADLVKSWLFSTRIRVSKIAIPICFDSIWFSRIFCGGDWLIVVFLPPIFIRTSVWERMSRLVWLIVPKAVLIEDLFVLSFLVFLFVRSTCMKQMRQITSVSWYKIDKSKISERKCLRQDRPWFEFRKSVLCFPTFCRCFKFWL